MLTIDKVKKAELLLKDVVRKTDLIYATALSKNADIYLKSENLQKTGSFKVRGAYAKIAQLSAEQKKRGIIACSAGNHAQGVALSAQKSGIESTIFIPSTAPISKIEATKSYGAHIRLVDGVYDDDPATNPNAKKIDCIRAEDIVKNNLKVIDMAAANLCFERKIPVIIFGLNEENSIMRAVGGEKIGTIVTV